MQMYYNYHLFIQTLLILNHHNYYFIPSSSSEICILNRPHKTKLQFANWKWYNNEMV